MISYQNLISQKGSFLDPFYIAQNINSSCSSTKTKTLDRNCEDPLKFAAAKAMILIFKLGSLLIYILCLSFMDKIKNRLAQNVII